MPIQTIMPQVFRVWCTLSRNMRRFSSPRMAAETITPATPTDAASVTDAMPP